MALLDDVATHLTNQSVVGGATGWVVLKGNLPEDSQASDQHQVVALFETGGFPPDLTPISAWDFPTFQVRVRGEPWEYDNARSKMQDVYDALNDASISSYVFVYASESAPFFLQYDGNDRPHLIQNYRAMKER